MPFLGMVQSALHLINLIYNSSYRFFFKNEVGYLYHMKKTNCKILSGPSENTISTIQWTISNKKSDTKNINTRYKAINLLMQRWQCKERHNTHGWRSGEYSVDGYTQISEPGDLLFMARELEHDLELKLELAESGSEINSNPCNWIEVDQMLDNLKLLFIAINELSITELKKLEQKILDTRKKFLKELEQLYSKCLHIIDSKGKRNKNYVQYYKGYNIMHAGVKKFKFVKKQNIFIFTAVMDNVNNDEIAASELHPFKKKLK